MCRAAPLWDRLIPFEYQFGTLETAAEVERRREDEEETALQALGSSAAGLKFDASTPLLRYKFGDLLPCSRSQYRHLAGLAPADGPARGPAGANGGALPFAAGAPPPGLRGAMPPGPKIPDAVANFMRAISQIPVKGPFPAASKVLQILKDYEERGNDGGAGRGQKRKGGQDGMSEGPKTSGPSTDVFRMRQQARARIA